MYRAQIRIFKQPHHVSFSSLLQRVNRLRLEPQIRLIVHGYLTDQALEGQLPNQQLCALLELADFSQRHRTRSKPVHCLDTCHLGRCLATGLVSQHFAWCFGPHGLARGLLCSGHRRILFISKRVGLDFKRREMSI